MKKGKVNKKNHLKTKNKKIDEICHLDVGKEIKILRDSLMKKCVRL
jgi:hypothetical protein